MSARKPPPGTTTIDQAFQKLLRQHEPHVACEQLNAALRAGRVKLFANGAITSPSFIAGHLLVTATASGGGWIAEMTALRALAQPSYVWTVSGLDGLLELPTDPPRRRGRKAKWDWPTICGEIARRCHNKSGHLEVPENERELARDMLEWCREEYDAEPAESEIRDAVKAVCARLR
jgi:hypothetical protein